MCGFVGIYRASGEATDEDERVLRQALARLAHRGPDVSGTYRAAGVGFAATRLAIQGDERADPPLSSQDGQVALAFTGEILGPGIERLRRFVRGTGGEPPPRAAGDGPLLAEALAALRREDGRLDGSRVLDLLEGSMGALACHDRPGGELLLARDRLGIKPLHVVLGEGDVRFASEIAPLLRMAPESRRPDFGGLAELLHWQMPVERLPFAGVSALPPGSAWRVSRGGRIDRWRIGPGIRDLEDRNSTPAREAIAALGEAWRRSAEEAALARGGVSLFLSGGVDSGAVALGVGAAPVLALTGRFEPAGGTLDESVLAAQVAAVAGLRHEIRDLSDRDLLADLPALVRALEIPMAGPGALALWRMARRAAAHGPVVLSGTGGDELLGGYVRTALVLGRRGPWTAGYEPLARRIDRAGADLASRRAAVLDRSEDLRPYLDPEFLRQLPRPVSPSGVARGEHAGGDPASALVAEEVESTLPMLLHVEDRITMAFGLEGRPVPCLGDVPRAAARIPSDWLVGEDGEGKRALRAALAGVMPDPVRLDPRKRGFPTPFGRAARGRARAAALAVLEDRRFRERGWWNAPATLALLDEERPVHDRALYAVLSWELWARAFLDGDALGLEKRV